MNLIWSGPKEPGLTPEEKKQLREAMDYEMAREKLEAFALALPYMAHISVLQHDPDYRDEVARRVYERQSRA